MLKGRYGCDGKVSMNFWPYIQCILRFLGLEPVVLWKTTEFDSFHYAAMLNNEHAFSPAGKTSKILNIYVLTVIRLPHGTNIFSFSLCFIAISCKRNCYLILSWKWNSAKREALTKQFLALPFRPTPAIRTLYSLAEADSALGFFRVKSMLGFLGFFWWLWVRDYTHVFDIVQWGRRGEKKGSLDLLGYGKTKVHKETEWSKCDRSCWNWVEG